MRPSSVSARRRVVRWSNWVPKCRSSAETWRLTAVSELGSERAAPERLPASTTRTKVANAANWSKGSSFRFTQHNIPNSADIPKYHNSVWDGRVWNQGASHGHAFRLAFHPRRDRVRVPVRLLGDGIVAGRRGAGVGRRSS